MYECAYKFDIMKLVIAMVTYEKIDYEKLITAEILEIHIEKEKPIVVDYHFHRSVEIILPIEGCANLYCEGKQIIVKPKEPYIINSKEIHKISSIFSNNQYFGYAFQISYEFSKLIYLDFDSTYFKNDDKTKELILPILNNILLVRNNPSSFQTITLAEQTLQLVKTLLVYSGTTLQNKDEKLMDKQKDSIIHVTEYINSHYMEKINPSMIAEHFHYSYGYLSKMFKKYTGVTLLDYINEIRIEKVEDELLFSKEKTILEISEYVGFPNVKSLNHYFKKKHGITPKEFRKNMSK